MAPRVFRFTVQVLPLAGALIMLSCSRTSVDQSTATSQLTPAAAATSASPRTPADGSTAARKGGEEQDVDLGGVAMTFCWIPAGEAQLGSPSTERQAVLKLAKEEKEPAWLASEAEEVRGKFRTNGFWLAKYPVTQEQWKALMTANPTPSHFKPEQEDVKKAGITDTGRFPVESVSWNDCQDFLKALNAQAKAPLGMGRGHFALPHENEWEYACRGGKGNKQAFYFGDRLNGDLANCDGNFPYGTGTKGGFKDRTTRVGEYEKMAPHPWGLCDMHGNVRQWCDNPHEMKKNSRILRSGSWTEVAWFCRSAFRIENAPDRRSNGYGFRACFRPD
jgi:formylglycine-generating enzyme required for sulfatase activity